MGQSIITITVFLFAVLLVPALLRRDDPPSLFPAPADVSVSVPAPSQPYLHDSVVIQQSVLPGAVEGGSVTQPLSHVLVASVGMSVHVNEADLTVSLVTSYTKEKGPTPKA